MKPHFNNIIHQLLEFIIITKNFRCNHWQKKCNLIINVCTLMKFHKGDCYKHWWQMVENHSPMGLMFNQMV